ncbi:Prokaryotic membrane lipoprotein lipid attachment site [Carpediemonas membranifera]|uniref:Prokaryotic membrane lipoprotein lipid attachment site n=1 Tax=Carpediemonas membranifera TaxID=201153 RepID=A0A8J6E2R0_9EUKA|nr:Prokaryotic membrane lipoprotein lipid attachment site [Carpediemonas membranifera]|eukprot:KAG9392197.1 Prokaryotic membrane lipoprotein lipid attachment site [Carpediemonas membranifera]
MRPAFLCVIALLAAVSCREYFGHVDVGGSYFGTFYNHHTVGDEAMIPITTNFWCNGAYWNSIVHVFTSVDQGTTWSKGQTISNKEFILPQAIDRDHVVMSIADSDTRKVGQIIDYSRSGGKLTEGPTICSFDHDAFDVKVDHIVLVNKAGRITEYIRHGDTFSPGVSDTIPIPAFNRSVVRIVDDDMILIMADASTAVVAVKRGSAWQRTQTIAVPDNFAPCDTIASNHGIIVFQYHDNRDPVHPKPQLIIYERSGTQLAATQQLDFTDELQDVPPHGVRYLAASVLNAESISIAIGYEDVAGHVVSFDVTKTGSAWAMKPRGNVQHVSQHSHDNYLQSITFMSDGHVGAVTSGGGCDTDSFVYRIGDITR